MDSIGRLVFAYGKYFQARGFSRGKYYQTRVYAYGKYFQSVFTYGHA